MSIKQFFKTQRDSYIIRQVRQAQIPVLSETPVRRYEIRFSGRVQKVGFRLELEQLAQRLALTGHCRNLPDGDVLAEIQGGEDRIQYLLRFMHSLKRIRIRRQTVTPLPIVPDESGFLRL